ncbi:hypothetical protein Mapa_003976 [Marchantia paleacea]|nr:hypothetical protein Mapa_003976 [Marchantia paleacea]
MNAQIKRIDNLQRLGRFQLDWNHRSSSPRSKIRLKLRAHVRPRSALVKAVLKTDSYGRREQQQLAADPAPVPCQIVDWR